jgi:hypothetical protein
MKKGLKIPFSLKAHRKWIIISAIILFVALIVSYVIWSMNTWSGYSAHYQGWRDTIKKTTDTALAMPTKTDQEKTAKITALSSVTATITNEKAAVCKVNSLVGWQNFIGSYKAQQADCAGMVGRLEAFSQKARDMTDYFGDEKALASVLTAQINTSEELAESTWGAKLAAWQGAHDVISKSTPSTSFKPVKSAAVDKTAAVVQAWQDLISANEAKSKAKFTEAQTKLNDSYGGIAAVATVGSVQFKSVTDSLQNAYTAAFK